MSLDTVYIAHPTTLILFLTSTSPEIIPKPEPTSTWDHPYVLVLPACLFTLTLHPACALFRFISPPPPLTLRSLRSACVFEAPVDLLAQEQKRKRERGGKRRIIAKRNRGIAYKQLKQQRAMRRMAHEIDTPLKAQVQKVNWKRWRRVKDFKSAILTKSQLHILMPISQMIKKAEETIQLNEDANPWRLDKQEAIALKLYTGGTEEGYETTTFYEHLNSDLRKLARFDCVRETIENLWGPYMTVLYDALHKCPVFEGFVYRGIACLDSDDWSHEYTTGRTIKWSAFTSTSQKSTSAYTIAARHLLSMGWDLGTIVFHRPWARRSSLNDKRRAMNNATTGR